MEENVLSIHVYICSIHNFRLFLIIVSDSPTFYCFWKNHSQSAKPCSKLHNRQAAQTAIRLLVVSAKLRRRNTPVYSDRRDVRCIFIKERANWAGRSEAKVTLSTARKYFDSKLEGYLRIHFPLICIFLMVSNCSLEPQVTRDLAYRSSFSTSFELTNKVHDLMETVNRSETLDSHLTSKIDILEPGSDGREREVNRLCDPAQNKSKKNAK